MTYRSLMNQTIILSTLKVITNTTYYLDKLCRDITVFFFINSKKLSIKSYSEYALI